SSYALAILAGSYLLDVDYGSAVPGLRQATAVCAPAARYSVPWARIAHTIRPSQAAKPRPFLKTCGSPTVATNAVAVEVRSIPLASVAVPAHWPLQAHGSGGHKS